ncbi:N-formylglutamate amidohydrolase [Rhodobacteraceae bacterium NNCM2]|nr:N-formylglutamate amidohydrolase [Coraliihabitans acroporae]
MTRCGGATLGPHVHIVNPMGSSSLVLICEHASFEIPAVFRNLGLSDADRKSHAAWDPGAMAVASHLSKALDAVLIAGAVSRLVYDCNRPPEAPDAMPAKSEVVEIPGNSGLSQSDRDARTQTYYQPFRAAVAEAVARRPAPIIVTIHSFTPVYYSAQRSVEIGVLHDRDTALADAILLTAARHTQADVQRNQPYGPEDGVTHTLKEHALPGGHLNVMLEIRNDLIATGDAQKTMADMIAAWLADAIALTHENGKARCVQ